MTPEQADSAVIEARTNLAEYKMIHARMPDRVRVAYRLGIPKTEIAKLSGLSRSTVDRYLGHQP